MATGTKTLEDATSAKLPPNMRLRPLPVALDIGTNAAAPTQVVEVTHANTGLPCRRCLEDGQAGEKMLLLSYDPFLGASPYRQPGPIFVHAEPECELATPTRLPDQQRARDMLALRAFDARHMMVECDVVAGGDLVGKVAEWFENGESEYVHVHFAAPGCFAVRIDKV